MSVKDLPCSPAPEVYVEVSQLVLIAAVTWLPKCIHRCNCAAVQMTGLDPSAPPFRSLAIGWISNYHDYSLVKLDSIGLLF
jgi:hypothetical protein